MDTTQFIKQSHDENMKILEKLGKNMDAVKEKEMSATEIELGGAKCPKCGEGVLGDVNGLCQNCI